MFMSVSRVARAVMPVVALAVTAPLAAQEAGEDRHAIASPDGRLAVEFWSADGLPRYRVTYDGEDVISASALGLRFEVAGNLDRDLEIAGESRDSHQSTWELPWGERRIVHDVHNELLVSYRHESGDGRGFDIRVRVFDEGLGFRYEVPVPDGEHRAIVDEVTSFAMPQYATAWWTQAADYNRYEYITRTTPLIEVETAHTPFTARLPGDGVHVAIHEAALVDYSGMRLDQQREGVLTAELAPGPDGVAVHKDGSFITPWRTIQVAEEAVGLINSDLILNLNEPNVLGDVSWVEPGKYVGIWWGMHIRTMTWGSGPIHGATTENAIEYIDFAAENGFDGVLVEGWNLGWDGDWFNNGAIFSFTRPYPDFDIEAVAGHARDRGVRLIGHHETSGHLTNYESQMEAAFDLYERLGVTQVKTGYVADAGDLIRIDENGEERREWHYGQYAVNHHIRVLEAAAERHISINTHEPVKDTGLRRTYPNWISREGARGQEFNAWGVPPNPPEHIAMLAFTRMLGGPMDFTPGIFNLTFNGPDSPNRVQTTLAKQLALYVVIYSPIQMAADLPGHYAMNPEAFRFIRDVPTDWEHSIALQGEVGDFVVTARQERGGADWYLGAVTDEEARVLDVPLDFLEAGRSYRAEIYRDGEDAHWHDNPYPVTVETRAVTSGDVLHLALAAGGGVAVRFVAGEAE
ncbi:glycoside hydrolase family 97 protein [Maricaulis sp.]|uniref:glycoside hydrolase family 97 protein n=1 Tax=Maricaulis sp. TaxID=1486257 RepID=UPI0026070712|nr:glycoside hydrolase family 97 protein [Maricaulis sp.]